ncbi:MAG TPA: ribosome-associated translation inhibitor RaiA [Acidimicrobiia bacterium]
MNLILTGRGVDLNDRLRGYATDKLTRVERFFDRIIKMEVELSTERNPRVRNGHRVEVVVKTPKDTLHAHGAGGDHFAAIDQAAHRLETQVKKAKARLRNRGQRTNHEPNGRENPGPNSRAAPALDEDGPVIVRLGQPPGKPMAAEEAVLELDSRGLEFWLYTDAETMAPAVVYRRGDGTYGVIEHRS